jgi:hypothetical protein
MDQNLTDLSQNPELASWLASLKKDVQAKQERAAKRNEGNGGSEQREEVIRLPRIDMSRKFYQSEGKTYPEFQGTISILPISYKNERVIELNRVYKCWCPVNDDWSRGFMYRILPDEYYPEGNIRNRIHALRTKLQAALDANKLSWKECKRQNISLMLGLVINHRNTKGDQVSSTLFGGDTIVEHRNVPALIIFPNNKLKTAIQSDLDMKPDPIPFAMRVYADVPLKDRKGWLTVKFTDASQGFGYDVSANTDIINPIVMPNGILPTDFNYDDERVKLLETTDPIRHILDTYQVGEGDGVYYNEESLTRLEGAVSFFINRADAKKLKADGKTPEEIAAELGVTVDDVANLLK